MSILLGVSNWIFPGIILFIVVYGLLKGVNVYETFVEGASEGIKVVMEILPTLIGLMIAVGMLRSSNALAGIARLFTPLLSWCNFPPEIVPVALMRTFSSSAATGLIIDLFKTYGPDSFIGRLASVMFGCTETIFYTMSVYFMTIGVKKSRYTLPGALLASLVGIVAAYMLTCYFFA